MKPHKHAEVIKAWADGAQIQWKGNRYWENIDVPSWKLDEEYRIKPKQEWPKSTLTDMHLDVLWDFGPADRRELMRNIADEAIAHACETGQVIPVEVKDE